MKLRTMFLSLSLLATTVSSQNPDVKEMTNETAYSWYYGVTSATLSTAIGNGYRITDIEVDSASPMRFNACLVRNTGAYSSGWWWYYGLTSSQLASNLSSNSARLIDLEPYEDANGNLRFACVMVPNTGINQKPWWYYYGVSGAQISSYLSTNQARPVDLESYQINGTTYYSCVMIRNTGADYRPYSWYYNVPFSTISTAVSNSGRRPYDLERHPSGSYDAILIQDAQPVYYTWWYGLDSAAVTYRLGQYGMRPIDIETYTISGQRRFAVLMVNNKNALTTSVGQMMRSTTDGQVGCYLNRINGSELAGLNEYTIFEPASTMKTLHHVHAMRQVMFGLNLNTPISVNTSYWPLGSSCPGNLGNISEPLTVVLRDMMENSDNARTQAIRAYFGEPNINATANALGMNRTELRHRIGCGNEAILNPNDITLYDLGLLHEAVANGYVGVMRDEFYEHMLNSITWAGINTVIDQEAAQLGLSAPAIASFKALVAVARKGGSYGLVDGSYRSGFGYVSVPFLNGQSLSNREYAVGAFVARATNGANASTAVNQAIAQMMRPTLRSALETWDVTAVATPFGPNCGGMNQTANGVPLIGSSVTYSMTGGHPWALDVFVVGFSDTNHLGVPLPLTMAPFGGEPGCFALCSWDHSFVGVANGGGQENYTIPFPSNYGLLGEQYFTQWFSFGGTTRASRGFRNVIGS